MPRSQEVHGEVLRSRLGPPDPRIALGLLAFGLCACLAAQETPASEPAEAPPVAAKLPWNQYANSWIALQLHITAMVDGAFFSQNAANVQQVGDLGPRGEFRLDDFEVDGQLTAPFPWSFEVSAEYDGLDQTNGQRGWTLSDLNISVPLGRIATVTVGLQSEGVTMERLSNSYDLSFMERSTMSTALSVPRNTGVRFAGTALGERMNWSAGWYNGWLANGLSFSESGNIFNTRVGGLPVEANGGRRLLHLGAWGAYAQAQEGSAQIRSRPEVYEAPYFVDTGSVPTSHTASAGFELAAVEGPVTVAAEYTGIEATSPQTGNPRFSGWYVMASWALTGETRPFDHSGGYFGELQPSRPFSWKHGGLGAWELAARYSSIDLTSRSVRGGKFDRWTGALSWFPTGEWRFEFNYGYGRLDRAGLSGRTHFYQLRLQFEI